MKITWFGIIIVMATMFFSNMALIKSKQIISQQRRQITVLTLMVMETNNSDRVIPYIVDDDTTFIFDGKIIPYTRRKP